MEPLVLLALLLLALLGRLPPDNDG